jgi:hypothetical protein
MPLKKRMLRWAWGVYKILCVAFCTLLILLVLLVYGTKFIEYVEIPNGLRLSQSLWHDAGGSNGFVLRDANGKHILTAKNAEIAWQDDYVFGMASRVTTDHGSGTHFIYQAGWNRPLLFTGLMEGHGAMKRFGLSGSLVYPPHLSPDPDRPDFSSKFDALERYREDVEDGTVKPYKCAKNQKDPCGFYSLYKTYLSLLENPRYYRSWQTALGL